MWFALAYLIFFTLDILFENGFTVFGMLPYHTLAAALSLYTLIMLRHVRKWCRSVPQIFALMLWQAFLITVLVNEFTNITYPFWAGFTTPSRFVQLLTLYDQILFCWGVILLVVSRVTLKPIQPLYPIFLFSAGAALFHYAVYLLISTMPILLYRYEGFLGLPMLFGWLMISIRIVKIRYDSEYWDRAIVKGIPPWIESG